jgi:hypothetical protein
MLLLLLEKRLSAEVVFDGCDRAAAAAADDAVSVQGEDTRWLHNYLLRVMKEQVLGVVEAAGGPVGMKKGPF